MARDYDHHHNLRLAENTVFYPHVLQPSLIKHVYNAPEALTMLGRLRGRMTTVGLHDLIRCLIDASTSSNLVLVGTGCHLFTATFSLLNSKLLQSIGVVRPA